MKVSLGQDTMKLLLLPFWRVGLAPSIASSALIPIILHFSEPFCIRILQVEADST